MMDDARRNRATRERGARRWGRLYPPHLDSNQDRRAAAILHVVVLLLALTTGVMLASTAVSSWIPPVQTIMVAVMFCSFLAMNEVLRRGGVTFVGTASVSIVMLSGVAASLLDPTAAVYTMPMMVGIMLAGLTLGPRAPMVTAVAAACWLGVMHHGQRVGWLEIDRGMEPLGTIIAQCFLIVLTGAVMTIAREALSRAFARIDRQEEQRRQLEGKLFQAQKIESIGRTAGGFAHDFNNLLGVVMANVGFLEEEVRSPRGQQSLADMLAATQAGSVLTSKMLALGRRQVVQSRVVDPASILDDFATVLRHMAGRDVHVALDCPHDVGRIKVDPNQLQQVLSNLVINASHVSGPEDVVRVYLDRKLMDTPVVGIPDDVPPGDYVCLVVEDTGTGMDEQTLASAFEPFFTTKPTERGSGLGLAVVLGAMRQSGGFITVQTRLGTGTVFCLWFPAVEAPVTWEPTHGQARGAVVSSTLGLQGMRIVIVDDDDALRTAVSHAICEAGAETVDFRRAQDALEYLGEDCAALDLVLTDVMMPEMSGPELVVAMRARGYVGPVVYVSGYVGETCMQDHLDRADLVLQKPILSRDLVAGLIRVLECRIDSVATSGTELKRKDSVIPVAAES